MKFSKFRWNPYRLTYVLFLLFYLWMAAQIPYTHDDWDWGTSGGIEQLVHATLNARYVGNFFVVIMTRSQILKMLIMGFGFFLLPYGLAVYAVRDRTEQRQLRAFLLSSILLFMMPREIWRQTYGWVSGFANYSVSAVFLLIWIREIRLTFSQESVNNGTEPAELLICFAGSFLLQMFLENLAIYTVMLGAFLCGVHYCRNKKVPLKNSLMLLGTVLGLAIMFSSRIYGSLWSTGEAVDGYRSLSVGTQYSLMTTVYMLLSQAAILAPLIFEENIVQCLMVLGLLSVLLLQKEQRKQVVYVLCTVNALFALWMLYRYTVNPITAEFSGFLPLVVNGAFFLTVAAETFLLLRGSQAVLGMALTTWFSVPGVILPLVFTLETGNRLFFTSNVFLILFAAILLSELKNPCSLKKLTMFLAATSLLLMCYYGYVYHAIGVCKRERAALMAQAKEERAVSVTLPHYPNDDYLWAPNPFGERRQKLFREFNHLPEDIEIYIQKAN